MTSLLEVIITGGINDADVASRKLANILKQEKIEVQELLAPGIIDKLNVTTSVSSINVLIMLGLDVYEVGRR